MTTITPTEVIPKQSLIENKPTSNANGILTKHKRMPQFTRPCGKQAIGKSKDFPCLAA
ncbi:hypothetical protein SLEP1_g9501 [Rubroshorea leprosula]|uniref:Uncharacterized protein n=1 Tax=Rubroshorea leprosula TaxID=152421 RepID=A0AAV5I541_9ROSI|nr:hypothetical protein SLEP1_g9501 [Rubroshorea leprosula]